MSRATQSSFGALRLAAVMVAALALGGTAAAAELKVLCTQALQGAMGRLGPQFEQATGDKLIITFGTTGALVERLASGSADVVIVASAALDELVRSGKVSDGSKADIGRSGVGIAVKSGAPKPDIGSLEALKRTLLAARSVAYSDPAKGGASGIHFAKVLDQLGIAEAMRAKTKFASGSVGALAASGEAEIAVQMLSELTPVRGVEVVGPLPADVQSTTLFSGAISERSTEKEAAKGFLAFLTSQKAAPILAASGLEPGK